MKFRKIFIYISIALVAVASASMFAAFEAHIINVTAHIENGLALDPDPINFGTVFPQEYIEKTFQISLSDSFLSERRVDDIKYVIKQKLKPCPVHKEPCGEGCEQLVPDDPTCVADTELETPHNPTGWHYLSLCPFLSKNNTETDGTVEQNDTSHGSYFVPEEPEVPAHCISTGPDAEGVLSKAIGDVSDNWIIDLKVPPIDGFIGQDWPESCVASSYFVNSNDKTYGCDLWIEASEISLPDGNGNDSCIDQADVMLVLDRSGSIDAGELATLKTAAHAFITALNPNGGVHAGQTSFATNGTLDTHLTNILADISNGIDGLVSSGFTNLYEGINLSRGELSDAHVHDRPAVPDYMVIITDGDPNRPIDTSNAQAMAASEAGLAKSEGITIYVVGVGVTPSTETYLKTMIANDSAHYFSADNYASLQIILEEIANCQKPT